MDLVRDQVEALDLWRRVTVTTVRSDAPDLTARQLAVLMTVRLQPAPHTVRGLASTLNVGKPAITRALDTLSRLGFVQRRRDPKDGRNVFVERTEKGDAVPRATGRHHRRRRTDRGDAASAGCRFVSRRHTRIAETASRGSGDAVVVTRTLR